MSSKRLNFAGLKDSRAKTTQLITALKVLPETLLDVAYDPANKLFKHGNDQAESYSELRVGNVELVRDPLRVGQLAGNEFTLRLRDLSTDANGQLDRSHIEHCLST